MRKQILVDAPNLSESLYDTHYAGLLPVSVSLASQGQQQSKLSVIPWVLQVLLLY
jgi:hypothetical protein